MAYSRTVLALSAVALFAASGVANANDKLIVAMPTTPPNVVHMPPLIAKELGLYKGVDVEFVALEGGVKTFRAMLSGNADVAMAPGTLAIVGRGKGSPTKIILSNLPKFEASMVVRANIKTMADLKGKRIGIQQPGGFADILSRAVLRAAKIDPKDVNFVSIATEDVPALVADQVDTAILHIEQEIVAQKKVPGLHSIARMWDLQPKSLYNVMNVTEKTIKEKPAALKAFVKANIEATRLMYTDRAKVMPIIIKATGYPKDAIERTYDFLVKECMWDANTGLGKERVNFTANLMTRVGNIPEGKTPSYEAIVDSSFAAEAVKELGEWKGPVCSTPVI